MPGPNSPYTALDFSQVIRQSFDESKDRLRVDATVTASISDVQINAEDSDIAIKDRVSDNLLKINSDGSLDVNVIISAATGDSIRIYDSNGAAVTLGQKSSALSIPVVLATGQSSSTIGTIESGTVNSVYNDVAAVASGAETEIVTYTALSSTRLKITEVTGTNIATYTVYVNSSPIHKKRTYFGNLDNNFQFSKGYKLENGDVISVTALHNQTSPGDFSGFILVLIDD